MRLTLTQCISGGKIGYHRFNMGAQISLSLLSFHFQKNDFPAQICSRSRAHWAASAGVIKECCRLAKYINDDIIIQGETG